MDRRTEPRHKELGQAQNGAGSLAASSRPEFGKTLSPHRLLTVPEAADRLRLSIRTLRALIASGALPVIRVSAARVCIDEADLVAYLDARRSAAGGART